MKVGLHAPKTDDKKRADLVFLIGNVSLQRIVIVELKASNIDLEAEHLTQLEYYMTATEEWLESKGKNGFNVFGHLIGTKAGAKSRKAGAVSLRGRIKKAGPESSWKVRDFLDVLEETKATHSEFLEQHGDGS